MFTRALILLLSLTPFSSQAPVTKRAFSNGPVITSNFPDPAFINVGGTSYAFATSNGAQNVQIATSPDFNTWTVTGSDALPTIPSWSTGDIWAPDVVQLVRTSTNSKKSVRLTAKGRRLFRSLLRRRFLGEHEPTLRRDRHVLDSRRPLYGQRHRVRLSFGVSLPSLPSLLTQLPHPSSRSQH